MPNVTHPRRAPALARAAAVPLLLPLLALPLLLLAPLAACGGGSRAARGAAAARPPRARADQITREEIERTDYANTYDLVQALHTNWLQPRGTDTFLGKPGEVQVRVDNSPLGGVERLREIPTSVVAYIQFVDGVEAASRWGIGYGHGAIHVITRTR